MSGIHRTIALVDSNGRSIYNWMPGFIKKGAMMQNFNILYELTKQRHHDDQVAAERYRLAKAAKLAASRPSNERRALQVKIGLKLIDWGTRLQAGYAAQHPGSAQGCTD